MSDLAWRKSSYSGSVHNCVEVALVSDGALVRDSKAPEEARVAVSADRWRRFLAQVSAGRYDV
ncbi:MULTISPECIES: DUF397 domain-containing protein [unclassified Actinopolyspora]|uniref:DUF397 domain-containing protein n=1 Tax=Actinopolyspora TaxID=1849 RepID=UPI0013F65321|nr:MULTISPECIES: DUF397 domain-containing protein [unclassified Actinopolyspora]NHD17808.1 DUF397 domain-containing protein [Actinopolyspora sp. BKK2]NHE77681.1 DUF397 domain-containing protein [Actinopolyspora sp. BKK1]